VTTTITSQKRPPAFFGTGKNATREGYQKQGRFPPVKILVTSLLTKQTRVFSDFLAYNFSSSVMVPVDSFSFTVATPNADPFYEQIKEGDLVTLTVNDIPLQTGMIDTINIQTDAKAGEQISVEGRDLMGQLEDQDAISLDAEPIFLNETTIENAARVLINDTRIKGVNLVGNAPTGRFLFATEPGEKKLSALQRFLEGLNCIAWMAPDGSMNVGKPSFDSDKQGTFILSKQKRISNVSSMGVEYSSTGIANIILPIWSGQEIVQDRIGPAQAMLNDADGPTRLRKLGHRLPQSVVISTPDAQAAQGQQDLNTLALGNQTLLQAYGKREIARQNVNEVVARCQLPGHINQRGEPIQVDKIYHIEYDRGSLDRLMYLFQADYTLDETSGQRSALYFTNLGTIVADARIRS
jgi:prophage tail gpP-like protein